jgi:NADPH-dependent 2,4-dienoyl-CoA reductase/sulfur reductase-like enzyme
MAISAHNEAADAAGMSRSATRRYVILGAGAAGVTAAETLCKEDPNGSVTLVNGEDEPPYARMAIPYVLTGKIGTEGTVLRHEPDHYARLGIRLAASPAVALDARFR